MHLQENVLFDQGQGHMKFEVITFEGIGGMHYLTFDIDFGVTCNVAQYSLHHVIYAPAEFEVATCEGVGGDAFTKMHNLTFDLGVKVTYMLPSTLCIIWPMYM